MGYGAVGSGMAQRCERVGRDMGPGCGGETRPLVVWMTEVSVVFAWFCDPGVHGDARGVSME